MSIKRIHNPINMQNQNIRKATSFFLSFLATFGIYLFLFDISGNTKYIVWLLIFVAMLFPIWRALSIDNKLIQRSSLIVSCLFSLFLTAGRMLDRTASLLDPDTSLLRQLGLDFFIWIGLMAAFYSMLSLLFDLLLHRRFVALAEEEKSRIWSVLTNSRRSFLLVWLFIFVCWLPYFIDLFPGVLSNDSCWQVQQIAGLTPITNDHPLIHTAFMGIFIKLGQGLGSLTLGVAIASVVQMALLSAIFSFTLYYLSYIRIHRFLRLIILLYYALFPINAIFSVTLWKDVLYGGIILLLVICLFEAVRRPESLFSHPLRLSAMCLLLFLFCTFRHNGLYAFILFIPFLLFALRRHFKKIALVLLGVIVLVAGYRFLIFSVLDIADSRLAESLSLPLQQIARTVQEHGSDLTEMERATISEVFDIDRLAAEYNPRLSNAVKAIFNEEAYYSDQGKYNALWLQLFMKYPGSYFNAFLANCYGYWYPEVNYWTVHVGPIDFSNFNFEIDLAPWYGKIFNGFILLDITELIPLNIPLIALLYSIGFMVWLVILSAAIFIVKGKKHLLLPLLLLLMLWVTTLASPVHAEYRYVYGITISALVCLSMAIRSDKHEEASNSDQEISVDRN